MLQISALMSWGRHAVLGAVAMTALLGCASTSEPGVHHDELQQASGPTRALVIAQVNEQKEEDLRRCLMRAQEETGAAAVEQVEVELQVPASGTPSAIRLVEPQDASPAVRGCVEGVLAKAKYGEAQSGQTFYQVFRLSPAKGRLVFETPVDAYKRWGLTRQEMTDVLVVHKDAIDECYALAEDGPQGRVVLTLTIESAGPPARVGLKSSTLGAPGAEQCLLEITAQMDFPEPRGKGVTVRDIEMLFTPERAWVLPEE